MGRRPIILDLLMAHKMLNDTIMCFEILFLFKLNTSFRRNRMLLHQEAYHTISNRFNCVNCIIINVNKVCDAIDFFCSQPSFRYDINRTLSSTNDL